MAPVQHKNLMGTALLGLVGEWGGVENLIFVFSNTIWLFKYWLQRVNLTAVFPKP